MVRIGALEIFIIIILLVIIYFVVGPKRIGRFFRTLGKGISVIGTLGKGFSLSVLLAIIGLVGGYILGSNVLPMVSFTSFERHLVEISPSNYTSGLQSQYSESALIGGIIGAIIFCVIGIFVGRLLKK